jgi:hypothetical protein
MITGKKHKYIYFLCRQHNLTPEQLYERKIEFCLSQGVRTELFQLLKEIKKNNRSSK